MNRLPKIIAALFVGSLLIGLVVVFGGKRLLSMFKPTPVTNAPPADLPPEEAAPPIEAPGLKLAREVASENILDRKRATTDLSLLEGTQPEAVAFLNENLDLSTGAVKVDIAVALGLLAPRNPEAVPGLLRALDDKDVRLEAMAALTALGPAGAAAVPALTKIYEDGKEPVNVRNDAAKALTAITGKKTAQVAPAKKKAAAKKKASPKKKKKR